MDGYNFKIGQAGKGSPKHLNQVLKEMQEYAMQMWLWRSIPGRGNGHKGSSAAGW